MSSSPSHFDSSSDASSDSSSDDVDIDMSVVFPTKAEAVAMFLEKNVVDQRPHRVVKSSKDRYELACRTAGCRYRACVRRRQDGLFHNSGYHKHSCQELLPTIKTAWVKAKAKEMLAEDATLKTRSLQTALRIDYSVRVPLWASQKGIATARASVSKTEVSYGKLVPLLTALRDVNPGTTTDVVVRNGRLVRAFLCLGACVTAFASSLKLVCLDACHAKTGCGGVLLVATGVDGNGNLFPIALAVAEGESGDSWTWFLTVARGALGVGDGAGVTVISDREKGIEKSVTDVLPAAHHAFCLFHVEKNVAARFKTDLNGLLWEAAESTTLEEYKQHIAAMRRINPAAADYIVAIPRERWVRAFFGGRRFGHLTSNVAESANAWLEEVRWKKPTAMYVEYVRKVNDLFLRRRTRYARKDPASLPKKVNEQFSSALARGRRLGVFKHSETNFEVQQFSNPNATRIVDLAAVTCTCGIPQDEGIPCHHVCAASLFIRQDPIRFVDRARLVSSVQRVYSATTTPIDITLLPSDGTLSPEHRRGRGRPRVKRIRSAIEKCPRKAGRTRDGKPRDGGEDVN